MNKHEQRGRAVESNPHIMQVAEQIIAEHRKECYKSLAADLPERQVKAEVMLKEGRGSIDAMLVKKRWWRRK